MKTYIDLHGTNIDLEREEPFKLVVTARNERLMVDEARKSDTLVECRKDGRKRMARVLRADSGKFRGYLVQLQFEGSVENVSEAA